jgi:ribosomal protein S7
MMQIKNKILNHLLFDGKKNTSEKVLLQGFKELQKFSKKQSIKLVQLAIVYSTPVFKVHKNINKNRKKKHIQEIPVLITAKKARVSLAIKFILKNIRHDKLNCFYIKFCAEILSAAKNEGFAIQIKNEVQKQVLFKKHFFFFYRWE